MVDDAHGADDERLVVELDEPAAREAPSGAGVAAPPPAPPTDAGAPVLRIDASDLSAPAPPLSAPGPAPAPGPARGPMAPAPAPAAARPSRMPVIDRQLLTTGWLGPFLQSWLVVGVVLALSLVAGGVLAYVATSNADAVRPGVAAGGFLFYAAFGGDVSVIVQHPASVVGFNIDALLISWVLIPALLYVALLARAWRRLGASSAAACAHSAKVAVCTAGAIAIVGLAANREVHRGTETIQSTASVASTLVRAVLLVAAATLVVAAASVLARWRAHPPTAPRPAFVRTVATGLVAGMSAAVLVVAMFGALGAGAAIARTPELRSRLPVGVMAPQLAGNLAGLATPVGLGGSSEVGAARVVGVSVEGARSVQVDRVQTSLGDDHAVGERRGPAWLPLVLLLLPLTVVAQTVRVLRRTRTATAGARAAVVAALVAGVVLVVAALAALAPLRVSGIAADPTTGAAVLGSADMTTDAGRAAWLAFLWTTAAAALSAVVWTSRHPVARSGAEGEPAVVIAGASRS